MLINYWDCKYQDYDEMWDGEEEIRCYGCKHPSKTDRWCDVDNKYDSDKAECPIAEMGAA